MESQIQAIVVALLVAVGGLGLTLIEVWRRFLKLRAKQAEDKAENNAKIAELETAQQRVKVEAERRDSETQAKQADFVLQTAQQNNGLFGQISDLMRALTEAAEARRQSDANASNFQGKLETVQRMLDSALERGRERDRELGEIRGRMDEQGRTAVSNIDGLNRQIQQLQSQTAQLSDINSTLRTERDAARKDLEAANAENLRLQSEVARLERRVDELQHENERQVTLYEAKAREFEQTTADLRRQFEELQRAVMPVAETGNAVQTDS